MADNFQDTDLSNVIINQLSNDKFHELMKAGKINNNELYITNDAFKDNAGGNDVLDIGQSLYIDESLGLRRWLNGQWIAITEHTKPFYERLLRATALSPNLTCSNDEYETILKNSALGQCGKFVIDTANARIRLPKVLYANGTLNLNTIGELDSQRILVARKVPTETDKSWYNWYSDGWCEQGGYFEHASSATGSDQQFDITLLIPYSSRNYEIMLSSGVGGSGWQYANGAMCGAGGSQMWASWQYTNKFHMCMPNGTNNVYCFWKTNGYAAIPTQSNCNISNGSPRYPYYIQIATGLETVVNISDSIQVINPYTLGESKYSPIKLNNLSWLLGGSKDNPRNLYPAYYDMLLGVLNGTKTVDGITVKKHTDSNIERTDHVINLTNETFTLPTLNGTECLPSNKAEDILDYNAYLTKSDTALIAPYNGWFHLAFAYQENAYIDMWNSNTQLGAVQSPASSGNWVRNHIYANKGDSIGIWYNATTERQYFKFHVARNHGYLYYYVGDVAKNADIINAGVLADILGGGRS